MAREILLLLLLNFVGHSLTFSFKDFGKSIHIAESLREKETSRTVTYVIKEKDVVEKNVPNFLQNAVNDIKSSRYRRDAASGLKPNSSSFPFNDSHSQMVIHWAGQNSDVILALTKGSEIGRPFMPGARHTSNVFVSHNYGRTFTSLNNNLKLFNGTQAIISQFFNAPSLNSHYIFTDETFNYVFTTRDYGKTILKQSVAFKPTKILIHKTNFSLVLGWDDSATGNGDLHLSRNFGETWQTIQSNVKAVFWEDNKYGLNSTCIYILRVTNNEGLGTIIRSCDFFSVDQIELLTAVHDFEIQGPYMFATRKLKLLGGSGYAHQIYVSYYRGRFINSMFPHDLTHLDYYVADASEDQIFMCVNHDEKTTHLYISNVNGTKFSQSLEDVLYFNPSGSNKNSWLRFYMDKPFADVHKVAGMRGVYIATQLINKTLSSTHQRSLITYDKGGEWQLIVAPSKDKYNRPTNCSLVNNCSLHVTQTFNRLYASSRATPILSKESSPGIILATGNYGRRIHVDEDVSVFLSTDAGFMWHQVLQGVHFFALADHGGIILAVKQYEPTNQIRYSTDEGLDFHTYNFTDHPIQIHGLLTEPGEKTTVFFLFGSKLDHHSWIVISLNLSSVFQYQCSDLDYKMWSLPDDTPYKGCLLGRKVMIERRTPHSNCYNGKDYDREITVRNCSCSREDFECDFGYKPNSVYFSVSCVPDPDVDQNFIHRMPSICPEGTFYPYTRGYAKISGDTCHGGEEHRYAPLMYACRAQDIEEFLLYSSRRTVVQKIFSSGQADVTLLDASIAKNVSAVDYQLGETGCLYWADNELHKIQRLCEDGNHSVEVLHTRIGEVPSLSYDWKGHNLYWIDREFRTIEVSKANGLYRRMLINGSDIISPTSLVIDPHHGWMYWADNGKIMKANMDGSHSSISTFLSHYSIGSDTTLTLDILTERIFWSGDGIRYASLRNAVVNSVGSLGWFHIDALGIYKEKVYWAESSMSRLYSCEVANCVYRYQDINDGIIDLKILDQNSQRGGNTACDHNGRCTHLCLLKPSSADVHGENRTCRCPNNATLHRTSPTQEDEHCCKGKGVVNVTTGACVKEATNCTENQFTCDNKRCIPSSYICDRDNDCGDLSDEQDCEFQTCSEGHFTCDNGRCIPEDWKCDFDNDCTDNSDERGCTYPPCPADKYTCSDGRCINLSWKCDFDDDCPDGSDERNCSYNTTDCDEGQFKCVSGSPKCVPDYLVCDKKNNCADGSDEKNCNNTCPSWKSSCGDGSCVYLSWVCDGDKDCNNGNDEINCTTTVAPVTPSMTTPGPCTGFVCDNGICIRNGLRCDGIDDCGDNSDEYRCGTVRPHTCLNNEFQCRNGRCVAVWMKCDSHNDCGDNTDEFNCEFTTSSPIIQCPPGKILCYNSSRRCLDESVMCDNFKDCEGGEDEQFCGGVTCDRSMFFKCHSSAACIPKKFVCDEEFNCPDGSDESSCGNQTSGLVPSNTTCKDHYFQCKYENKCIPYMFVCDGKAQCQHKSDENLRQCFDSSLTDFEINAKMGATNASVEWAPVTGRNVIYTFSYLAYFHQAYNWNNRTSLIEPKITLSHLHSALTYYMTVYATIGKATHRYKIIQVTTLDDVPDVPRYVGLSNELNSQTIEVYWGDPRVFKGKILYFEVCIGKTENTINYCVQSKKNLFTFDSLENEQPFVKGQKYFVQVSAVNSVGEGEKSKPQNITFGVAGISSYVGDLEGIAVGNTSMKLTWTAPKNDVDKIDNYVIVYQTLLGNMVTKMVDNNTFSYEVDDLCPGSWYTFSVAPRNKNTGKGPEIYISSKTAGAAIGKVSNITVEWIAPTKLKVSWKIPEGAVLNQKYTVYYDYDPDNLHSHKVSQYAKNMTVTTNYTLIGGLRGCEFYFFRVAAGNCLLSEVKSETTYYDALAEPEDLVFHRINLTSGNLTWKASCPDGEPTGYIVNRTEVATRKSVFTQPYINTSKAELSLCYKTLIPGATYKITITNTNKPVDGVKPKSSEPLVFTMDPYPNPINLHVKSASEIGDSGVLVWVKPLLLPKEKFIGYEILLCSDIHNEYNKSGKCMNNNDYRHYAYSKNTTAAYSGLTMGYHYFKVRLNKIDGYYGNMSAYFTVTVLGGVEIVTQASSLQLSKTNLIAICVSVGVVITALVVIIGCFVVRHRRLQKSFHAYARSHYDSSSGTTTFSAADELEDEDSPMIRGFSDDEPLVIA